MDKKTVGVLLVNLGTPQAPTRGAVKRYLTEFLTDPRVIPLPTFARHLLVRSRIIPQKLKTSTENYQRIWQMTGSPLSYWLQESCRLLQEALPSEYLVMGAMRYQTPSINAALEHFYNHPLKELVIIPLFSHYASATSGSIIEKCFKDISKSITFPAVRVVSSYPTHPLMIQAYVERINESFNPLTEHLLLSFHGLPISAIRSADRFQCCLKKGCCEQLNDKNRLCYKAQCEATARAIMAHLDKEVSFSIAFQSRLGKSRWTEPYLQDELERLIQQGKRRVVVVAASFVADCVETLDEIAHEYARLFKKMGGESLRLVPSLNDHPLWIKALAQMAQESNPT